MHNSEITNKKICLIISDNSILHDSLVGNLDFEIISVNLDYKELINKLPAIHCLILDKKIDKASFSNYKIKETFNCSGEATCDDDIFIQKPIKLQYLINRLSSLASDSNIFCMLNKQYIYDEQNSKIQSNDNLIILTEKENILFKEFLKSANLSLSKTYLKEYLWNYHTNTESSTIETHLYKLKKKLPQGWLTISNDLCALNLT